MGTGGRRAGRRMSATPLVGTPDLSELAEEERPAALAFLDRYPPGEGTPLAVVIAAYDEEGSIAEVVTSLPAQAGGLPLEVIVVVDGALDGTAARGEQAGALVCDVAVNRGQGAALRLGYFLARTRGARIIATTDADGQYDAAELGRVVAPVVEGTADFVTGSRRLGSELTTDGLRHAGVVFFGLLISVLTGQRVTDPACGLRAMRAEVTAAVTLEQPQYQASELMIATALAGYRLAEVPITMRPRSAGTTKKGGNVLYGVRFTRVVLGTWWRDRSASGGGVPWRSAKITSS
jgi:hypothetical protein